MKVSFKVNGQPRTVDVPGEMPLLWTLRDTLNLKGTKFGCGAELCGACTVHLNGGAVRSCSVATESVQGASITTIEGLSPTGTHPLQQAWTELDVPQCGYCQAGQLMAAAELLSKHPNPTDDQIASSMDNLCRCATYLRIRQAVHRAAELQAEATQSGATRKAGGKP
jgi:isoquinoline 1-oxidoreductase subunit alpha